jgi:hypothetical protein
MPRARPPGCGVRPGVWRAPDRRSAEPLRSRVVRGPPRGRPRGSRVVVGVLADERSVSLGVRERRVPAEVGLERMEHQKHQMTARREHPREPVTPTSSGCFGAVIEAPKHRQALHAEKQFCKTHPATHAAHRSDRDQSGKCACRVGRPSWAPSGYLDWRGEVPRDPSGCDDLDHSTPRVR